MLSEMLVWVSQSWNKITELGCIQAFCPQLYRLGEGYDGDEDENENDLEDIPEAMASTPYLHK